MTAYSSSLLESLTNYDSLKTVMPHWLVTSVEALTTDDTLRKAYSAVRLIDDITGAAELGDIGLPFLFTSGGTMESVVRDITLSRITTDILITSDICGDQQSLLRPLSETLVLSDLASVRQRLKRGTSDSIPYHGESVTHRLGAYRAPPRTAGCRP